MGGKRRAIIALAAACLLAPAAAARANPYGAPGSLTDADSAGGGLGQSASLSADGSVAVLGEPNYNGEAGAALVYARSGGGWSFVQRLTPSDQVGAGHFGAAVHMDPSGDALIVGAPDDSDSAGSAWVFVRSDGTWTEQGHLASSLRQAGAKFGASVALSSGGTLALVGAPLMDGKGQAYTFFYQLPWRWFQYQQMGNAVGINAGSQFGASVALDSNGGRGIVGAPGRFGSGMVYVYSHYGLAGSDWIFNVGIHSPAAGGSFGADVALSLTGDHAIVGAPLADAGDGAVYEYRPDGTQEATFSDPSGTGAGGHFGASLAVAGRTMDELIVGAPNTASVYDFDAAGGANWLADGALLSPLSPPALADSYGAAVAVAGDASAVLVGAPGASSGDGGVTHFSSALTAPGAPTSVQAVASSESAEVSWTAPLDSGGLPITDYIVTSSPDGLLCFASGTRECTVTGLTNGRQYTFTVTATNSRGTSAPSAPSNAVTPQAPVADGGGDPAHDPPASGAPPATDPTGPARPAVDSSAPTKPRAPLKAIKVKRTSITLTWGAATDDLGVAGYRVIAYDAAGNASAPLVGGWVRTR